MDRYYHWIKERRTRLSVVRQQHHESISKLHLHVAGLVPATDHRSSPILNRLPMALSGHITTQFLYLYDITAISLVSLSLRQMVKYHIRYAIRFVPTFSMLFPAFHLPCDFSLFACACGFPRMNSTQVMVFTNYINLYIIIEMVSFITILESESFS
jgi:hypothetical protein